MVYGTYLLNMMEVLKSEVVGMKRCGFGGGEEGREGRRREGRGWWTLCTGTWETWPLAFPGWFCRWSRDQPSCSSRTTVSMLS